MEPRFVPGFVEGSGIFERLRDDVLWVNRSSPRGECFMAAPGAPNVYSYGNNNETRTALHTYTAVEMHPAVALIMSELNAGGIFGYNICVLNYYKDQHQHLGWHADDSPEQDLTHPIAVVSFGAEREIWVKRKDFKGPIPDSQKYSLSDGSLFLMPGGFQAEHFHRIPKHGRECGGRVSLTFRRLVH